MVLIKSHYFSVNASTAEVISNSQGPDPAKM